MDIGNTERVKNETKNLEHCHEYCNENIAVYYCPQCWTNYCHECYDKEHRLKRSKEDHDRIHCPRQTCPQHRLTLEYRNKGKNTFLCCMCVKEMSPADFAADSVEPIDGVATVLKPKLSEKVEKLDLMSSALRNKIEACSFNVTTSIEAARSEVRRFFAALNLLLTKQEESFQQHLTTLLGTSLSKPIFCEMAEILHMAEALSLKGRALLAGDGLGIAREYDTISTKMDKMLQKDTTGDFGLAKLNVAVNVHRQLMEMIRHPGYISSTFCLAPRNNCKAETQVAIVVQPHQVNPVTEVNNVNAYCNNTNTTIPATANHKTTCGQTQSSISMLYSPPLSLPDDDTNTPYCLVPSFSRSSSPMFLLNDDNTSLRPLAANTVTGESLNGAIDVANDGDVCSCLSVEDNHVSLAISAKRSVREGSKDDCDLERKGNVKRKFRPSDFQLPSRKTRRRQDGAKELNRCDVILTELWASDDSFPFVRPVDAKKVPSYYEMIKKPMDLSQIKEKLDCLSYDCVYDFVEDMKLIFDNCFKFNHTSSDTFQSGRKLERMFMELLNDSFPFIYYESSVYRPHSPSLLAISSTNTVAYND